MVTDSWVGVLIKAMQRAATSARELRSDVNAGVRVFHCEVILRPVEVWWERKPLTTYFWLGAEGRE